MQMAHDATIGIMTYNILVGGREGRLAATEAVIRQMSPDIVGIQEASDPDNIRAMADRLGMACVMGISQDGYHVALLSRWPIVAWAQHVHPLFQKALLEAVVAIPGEAQPWHLFVTHLTAQFWRGTAAEEMRRDEMRVCLAAMADLRARDVPHLIMGDFNSLAPGEPFNAIGLLSRVIDLDDERARRNGDLPGQPHLKNVVPPRLHPLLPIIRQVPRHRWTVNLFQRGASRLFPRLTIPELQRQGYADCLRWNRTASMIPPTCPLPHPAGRIDYIWVSPDLAGRIASCDVAQDSPECPILAASDHVPVLARFTRVTTGARPDTMAQASRAME